MGRRRMEAARQRGNADCRHQPSAWHTIAAAGSLHAHLAITRTGGVMLPAVACIERLGRHQRNNQDYFS
ncbi:MAG: hypothetical protein V7700_02880 [Halioglobus sp.]